MTRPPRGGGFEELYLVAMANLTYFDLGQGEGTQGSKIFEKRLGGISRLLNTRPDGEKSSVT